MGAFLPAFIPPPSSPEWHGEYCPLFPGHSALVTLSSDSSCAFRLSSLATTPRRERRLHSLPGSPTCSPLAHYSYLLFNYQIMDSSISIDNPPSHSEVVFSSPLVPPVHRLPVELLSEVFVELDLVQEDVYKQKPAILYGPHLLAVTAACVCRKWRAVALSTHDLWTSIIITDETRHMEAYIDACVTNSGLRGLELRCTSKKFLPTLLSRLLPHCARWAILSLDSAREEDVAVLSREEYSFNRLKGFRLQSCCEILPGALDFLSGG